MTEITIVAALLGGVLTLLSPCSALLLPAFFAYSFETGARLVRRTAVFYLGLCTTLVPLGAAGAAVGGFFNDNRQLLIAIGGWTLIALGMAQALGFGFGFGSTPRRLHQAAAARRTGSAVSVYLLGAAYGLAGFCAGPILGGILTLAAMRGEPLHGGVLLAVYGLGMAVPLFALAFLWDRYDLGRRRLLRGRPLRWGRLTLHSTSLIGGVVFVAVGAAFLLFDGMAALPSLMGVDEEADVQATLARLGSAVSDQMLLWTVAAAAIATAAVSASRALRARTVGEEDAAPEDEHQPGPPVR